MVHHPRLPEAWGGCVSRASRGCSSQKGCGVRYVRVSFLYCIRKLAVESFQYFLDLGAPINSTLSLGFFPAS